MDLMFAKCTSLISLPDISKWNTNNLKNVNPIFPDCTLSLNIPDISKWKNYKEDIMKISPYYNLIIKINMFLDIHYDLYDFLFDDSNPDIFKLYDYDYEFLLNNIKKSLKDFMN